jgi:hypothetical protein
MNGTTPLWLLSVLLLTGTCSTAEVESENAATYVPQDALSTWAMHQPAHIVDLVMWFYAAADTSGVVPWDRLLKEKGPITWRESRPQLGKGGWKGVKFLNGHCTIALKANEGVPSKAKAFVLVKGDDQGARSISLNSGYDRDWGGRYFEPALWMDVDTARYDLVEEWNHDMDGKTFAYTYTLELPQRPLLTVVSRNSCGTLGCDFHLIFSSNAAKSPNE